MRIISEAEFAARMREILADIDPVGCVTGPGRSGAVAAVYASHILAVPFIPQGAKIPYHLGRLLVIDTARESGQTLRKAVKKIWHPVGWDDPLVLVAYEEPPRVAFWYEAPKPQRYRHERAA